MLTVGPVAENCFIVTPRARDHALIVDPGDEAERILGAIDDMGAERRGRSCSPTPTSTTSARWRRWRRRPARRSGVPRSRPACSPTSTPTSPGRASGPSRTTRPTTLLNGRREARAGRLRDRRHPHARPQPRATSPTRSPTRRRSSPATCSSRARSAASTCRAAIDGPHPAGEHRHADRDPPARDPGLSGPHGPDHARSARCATNPFLRALAR